MPKACSKRFFINIFQEIFPFIYYIFIAWQKTKELDDIILNADKISDHVISRFNLYKKLDTGKLSSLLTAEHTRADDLNSKTFKFGGALAIGLTFYLTVWHSSGKNK